MDEDSVSKAGQEEQESWRELLADLELEKTSSPKAFLDLDYDPFEEKRGFTFQSLNDALQAIIECVSEERGSQWKIGILFRQFQRGLFRDIEPALCGHHRIAGIQSQCNSVRITIHRIAEPVRLFQGLGTDDDTVETNLFQ